MVRSRQPVTRAFTTFYQIDVLPVTAGNLRAKNFLAREFTGSALWIWLPLKGTFTGRRLWKQPYGFHGTHHMSRCSACAVISFGMFPQGIFSWVSCILIYSLILIRHTHSFYSLVESLEIFPSLHQSAVTYISGNDGGISFLGDCVPGEVKATMGSPCFLVTQVI